MSRSDYERPAWYQIEQIYKCRKCGDQQRPPAGFAATMPCPHCGGWVDQIGEQYPASADDWDEMRESQDGEWRRK